MVGDLGVSDDSNRQVNEWFIGHMDKAPFHKLCYDFSITAKLIIDYLIEIGNDSALVIDTINGMTPLQMLPMNPHASAESIEELAFYLGIQEKIPLEYTKDYNVD